MVLTLRYGDLSSTISETNRLANELGQYCDALSQKVQQKMYAVEGGMSSALNSADYYVKAKITQLRTREDNARMLATKVQTLLDTAKRVDEDVEKTIQANQKSFFQQYSTLKAPWYERAFYSFLCDMKNVPVLGWLIEANEQAVGALDALMKDIRYWYKCEGGKELVGIALSVAGAVLAVVALFCAFTFTGGILVVLVSVAGFIGALIGGINAIANVLTSCQAYGEAIGGHPGMAKIYAGQDTVADVLRQKNFDNKFVNNLSNTLAIGIEITEAVCSIVALVKDVADVVDAVKKLGRTGIKKTFQAICQPRGKSGRFAQGKPTLWNGIRSIALKPKLKDFVLGDLNVKNLSRLFNKNLSRISKLKPRQIRDDVVKLVKAGEGIVDGLDKVNEGEQSLSQFLAKRAMTGLDTTFFKQQVLDTRIKDGKKVRMFYDTNFTVVVKALRTPIDELGLGKFIFEKFKADSLSDTLNMKDGIIKNATNITDLLSTRRPSHSNGVVTDVKNWDRPRGYFDGIETPSLSTFKVNVPLLDTTYNVTSPTFIMPALDFNYKLECRTPYYNITAAT